jgi:ComF family protein
MKSLWKTVTDVAMGTAELAAPARCLNCGGSGLPLCSACTNRLARISGNVCTICGDILPEGVALDLRCSLCKKDHFKFDMARCAFLYKDPIDALIKKYKYGRNEELAEYFGGFMREYFETNDDFTRAVKDCDIVTGVPLHWMRYADRKYNHSGLLADQAARFFGRSAKSVLWRNGKGRKQSRMRTAEERRKNIIGAFSIRLGAHVEGRKVLVVDDVMTTGSTLSECAKVLKKGGADRVVCFALTRRRVGN